MNERNNWVGFDLGGTKMMAQVFDADFRLLDKQRRPTEAASGQEVGLARIIETIRNALDSAGVSPETLAGIGVGSPGPLDHRAGTILNTPNLAWGVTPLGKRLTKEFNCPVHVLNDVDAGLYGEYRFGAARGASCALGVFPGTGIGGACVYRGSILMGKTSSCMEIGHITVLPEGPLCGCGRRGCLEAVASRLAIAAACAQAAYRGKAPTLFKECGTDIGKIKSKQLANSIEAGDTTVKEIVVQAAEWIGKAVADVVNLLAPDRVVLGGGLVNALPDLLLANVRSSAERNVMKTCRGSFDVVVAKLGDDATAKGAAAYAQEIVNSGSRANGR